MNVDLRFRANVWLDLRRPLPFSSDSCVFIYTEQFLEHLDYPEPADTLLAECRRVLQERGTLGVFIPDSELVLESYVNGGTEEYYVAQKRYSRSCPWGETQMEYVNHSFRQGGRYRFSSDFETLKKLLETRSLVNVQRSSFDPAIDSERPKIRSLYVTCQKLDNAAGGQSA